MDDLERLKELAEKATPVKVDLDAIRKDANLILGSHSFYNTPDSRRVIAALLSHIDSLPKSVQGEVEELRKQVAEWSALATINNTLWQARAEAAEARVRELERRVAEEERLHEHTLKERDRAQDALQNTHTALGGDGEWVGKSVRMEVPNSGDLHEDVPALAANVLTRVRELEAKLSEESARADDNYKSFERIRKKYSTSARNQRTPGTVEVCKDYRTGCCGDAEECTRHDCPIKRSVSPSP